MKCPNKNTKHFKQLSNVLGSDNHALLAWEQNGQEFPQLNKDFSILSELYGVEGAIKKIFEDNRQKGVKSFDTEQTFSQTTDTGIKPGVAELFESNPELANAVYEAAGFNDHNFELKENEKAFGAEPHPEGATSYDIFSNGRKIGKIALFDSRNPMIKGLDLNESERNKGLGKALYKWLNYRAILKGGRLYGDQDYISPDAQRVWKSLNKEGLVDLTGNSPKFNDKQKQQAQQLYSQYLDTIFPDSKVAEMDNSLYISVLEDLKSNKIIEKQCS